MAKKKKEAVDSNPPPRQVGLCPVCGKVFLVDVHHIGNQKYDSSSCKNKANGAKRVHGERERERERSRKRREQKRQYRLANPEKVHNWKKNYRLKNPDKIKASNNSYAPIRDMKSRIKRQTVQQTKAVIALMQLQQLAEKERQKEDQK
jgi:hypothetical protein